MSDNITIGHIPSNDGKKVRIMGWVTHVRSSGKLIFIEIRDGSGRIQCVVFKSDTDEETFETAKRLSLETSVAITGTVRRDDRSKFGYELRVAHLEVIQMPNSEYPIAPKRNTETAFLMDNRHLWILSSPPDRDSKNPRNDCPGDTGFFGWCGIHPF
jgi:asparaginyl-tRNA synthetase